MNNTEKIRQICRDFEPLDAEKHDIFEFETISSGNSEPPVYIVSLLLNFLGFKKYGGIEKVKWLTMMKFKGFVFELHDYKFGVWTIAGLKSDIKEDKNRMEKLADEIKAIFINSAPHFDKELNKALISNIKKNNFYFNNVYRKLYNYYNFYYKKVNNGLRRVEKVRLSTKKEQIKTPFGEMSSIILADRKTGEDIPYFTFALMNSFFSLLEFWLDIFVIFEKPSINFLDFKKKNWQDKFKLVFDISDAEIKNIYGKLLDIKRKYRNPLSHGLNSEVSLLVAVPGEGLIPLSYEFLKETPHFSSMTIGIDKCKEAKDVFENFFSYIKKKVPYFYYFKYIENNFSIPRDEVNIEHIKSYMTSKKDFNDYIDGQLILGDMIDNREI